MLYSVGGGLMWCVFVVRGSDMVRNFEPASRITPADVSGDIATPRRLLSEKLYMVIRGGSFGGDWGFPLFAIGSDENNLRSVLEGQLGPIVGSDLDLHYMGHAPLFHTTVEEPTPAAHFGAKTFFFPIYSMNVSAHPNVDGSEVAWLSRDEIVSGEYVKDAELRRVFALVE